MRNGKERVEMKWDGCGASAIRPMWDEQVRCGVEWARPAQKGQCQAVQKVEIVICLKQLSESCPIL